MGPQLGGPQLGKSFAQVHQTPKQVHRPPSICVSFVKPPKSISMSLGPKGAKKKDPFFSADAGLVTIGSSNSNTKTATVSAGCTCPSVVSKANWVGGETHEDKFAIEQTGTSLTARRTDANGGWGMDLKISCTCTRGLGLRHMYLKR